MLDRGERISARGVLRHLSDVRAASSLTRDPLRRALLDEYRERQAERLAWSERAWKLSVARLETVLAARDRTIADLEHRVQLLVASHRALVDAVGELGGLPKWKQVFERYERCVRELADLGAMPDVRERPTLVARRRTR
jgi:hypothetical protein